eukprot:6004669-Pyramimonas_sp.AAC.1
MTAGEVALGAKAFACDASAPRDVTEMAKTMQVGKKRTFKDASEHTDSRNVSRNLLRTMAKFKSLPTPVRVNVPLWDANANSSKQMPVSFLFPHIVLQSVVPEGEEAEYCSF